MAANDSKEDDNPTRHTILEKINAINVVTKVPPSSYFSLIL